MFSFIILIEVNLVWPTAGNNKHLLDADPFRMKVTLGPKKDAKGLGSVHGYGNKINNMKNIYPDHEISPVPPPLHANLVHCIIVSRITEMSNLSRRSLSRTTPAALASLWNSSRTFLDSSSFCSAYITSSIHWHFSGSAKLAAGEKGVYQWGHWCYIGV